MRAVCFDLGGTLVDEREPELWAERAAVLGLDVDPEALAHFFAEAETENDAAGNRWSLAEFWTRVLDGALGRPVEVGQVERFMQWFLEHPAPAHLFSDVRRCLEELGRRRLRLGVISNSRSEESVRGRLEGVGILGHFQLIVSSGTEGVAKPDPEIFRRAAERLGLPIGQVFYVGNLAHVDALAAQAAGMRSVWLHREGTGFGEDPPEITSLLEVPAIVDTPGASRPGP